MKKLFVIAILVVGAISPVFAQPIPSSLRRFLRLLDTPSTYTDQADKYVRVNSAENALEFAALSEFITLGTHTTGNYVATIADAGNSVITVSGSGSESAAVTLDLTAGGITEAHLKAVDSATDEDIFTYESTTGDFEWHTIAQMLALTDSDSLSEGSTNLYQDSEVTGWIDDVTLGSSGALTIPTGQAFVVGTTTWTSSDEIDGTKIKDADYGDIAVSAGGAWTLDGDAVDESHIADNGIDSEHYNDDSIDNAHINWGDIDNLGNEGLITVADTTDATSFVALWESATGDLAAKSDGVLLYAADSGTLTATILLEGANAIPNATDHLGFFGGTTSAELLAEISNETGTGLLVFATAPTFTTSIKITGADANPGATGVIVYDSTVSGMSGGALRWYDDDSVRLLVDLETDATDDDYVVAYDAAADGFYMKADADSGGATAYDDIGDPDASGSISFDAAEAAVYTSSDDEWVGVTISNTQADNAGDTELLTLAFTDDGDTNSHYLIMSDAAGTQQLEVIQSTADIQITTAGDLKLIAGGGDFTFDDDNVTTTGTIEGATITEGGVAVYNDNEIDEFSELDSIVADKSLVNLEDGGTFTGGLIANANLSVGNTTTTAGVLTLLEDDDDGSNFASFMVPALAANTVYTLPPDDGDNTEVLQTNGSGTLTWVANAGGATAWDDIGDPDAAATVDFVTYTQTIDIGKSDSGGGSGLILDATGLGNGTDDVIVLEITTVENDDTDYIPIAIYDDDDGDNDLLFQVDSTGGLSLAGSIDWSLASITGTGQSIQHTGNSDDFYINFIGADVELLWSDGTLTFRNQEDGVDAIVEIEGKDAGEKGILRVMSDGDDKYIELYHDDTDAQIVSSSGDVKTANLDVTTELTIPDGTDPDVDAAGEISIDTDGANEPNDVVLRTIDGNGTQVALAQEQKSFQATIIKPNDLADTTRDACPIWSNETGMTFVITKIEAWSDTDDTTLNVEAVDSDGVGSNNTVDALEIATGSGPYTVTETTITAANILANRMIFLDFDDTDDPGWVKISICGYFLSDVD